MKLKVFLCACLAFALLGRAQHQPSAHSEDVTRARAAGISVSTPDQSATALLSLAKYGCAGAARAVNGGTRAERGGRLEYRHAGIVEWYAQGGRGIEQGFDLERMDCGSEGIELEIAILGLTPRVGSEGLGLDLLDARGRVRMHYTDLSAVDAAGKSLPATMTASSGRIALHVARVA